ncbi:MAG: endo-1,4-beta-xylanase [Treponema sp.]|jgi:GH35 family endo-1,4-beta-xylanase|nr:endo-1,4-beta-xylanase [Treponema sp.]
MDKNNNDPYFREDPGVGFQRVPIHKFELDQNFSLWKSWRTNDGRILPNVNSSFELVNNPFEVGSLLLLTTYFDPAVAGKSFGGFGMRAPVSPAVEINSQTFVEFDLYYPKSAAGKYMRFEIWSTSSGGAGSQGVAGITGDSRNQVYIRTADLDDLNNVLPDWIGFYNGETWFKKSICVVTPVSTGRWEYLNLDLHTEVATKLNGDQLMIGNIRITQIDVNGTAIPDVINIKSFNEVEPFKSKYNKKDGYFLMGTVGIGKVEPDSIRGHHYEIFVDDNYLKPECHINPPQWLKNENPSFVFKIDPQKSEGSENEWSIPTGDYVAIRDSGKGGEYKVHGHCLAWINQSPPWMRQIVPENVTSMQWRQDGLFFAGANNATGPYLKLNKDSARRIYFNHIVYIMRHFMTTSTRYGSSEERGIIPFHSFDVINVELHESRHSIAIKENPDEWKSTLRHISWLMAMTDTDIDLKDNYIYLLFKYAHIAVPNAQMAAKYKAGYNDSNIVPEYMKMDSHDDNGSIDAYITEKPPILTYNDYEINLWSKAKTACNMIEEINNAWKADPLYDGRNLIECMGIQGHDVVTPVMSDQNLQTVAMFVDLIDDGLLDCICYSEIDMRQQYDAPGGNARAPAVLNEKQADAIGYQYALLFKLLEKYKKYIDHVIFWGQFGASWMSSYVPFDHEKKASQAYYAIMDPDRFIQGHSYLDEYFAGEYEKVNKI